MPIPLPFWLLTLLMAVRNKDRSAIQKVARSDVLAAKNAAYDAADAISGEWPVGGIENNHGDQMGIQS